ncbi:IS66 family transposase zinc-finger binding domain-containing protein [Paraburkholderia sp. RL18-103-BIB-C]
MGHKPQDCDCPECGGRLRKLGEDASEMLDYVPGYFHAAATDPTTRT